MKQVKKMNLRKALFFRMLMLLLFCSISIAFTQAQTITGSVIDENNEPLIGVSVLVKGTTIGTITDIDGNFSVNSNDPNAVLVFSLIGFKKEEIPLNGRTNINLTMKEDNQLLDEVVVVGFGTQKKVNLTGSISNVGSEVFENRPVANIGQALQGVVPNLNINIDNGAPNTAANFNIRGGTSMKYDKDKSKYVLDSGSPLILLDGMEVSKDVLNQLNPNDISDMSVIKDASAAAIYGTKATYGVILIQTKKGASGKAKINYSFDISWDTPAAIPDILDSYHIQLANNNKTRWRGNTVSPDDELLLENMQKYINDPRPENAWFLNSKGTLTWCGNTNPYDEAVRDWTPMQKHNLSISGGSDKFSYYISLGYQDQEGMYKIETDEFKRYNALLNVTAKLTSWFNISAKASYNRTSYHAPYLSGGKGNFWAAMRNEPGKNVFMPIKSSPTDPVPNTWTDNIVGWLGYGANYDETKSNTILSMSPEFIILPNMLNIKSDLAFTTGHDIYDRIIPKREYITNSWTNLASEQTEGKTNAATKRRNNVDFYTINVYADFNKTFAQKHQLAGVLGFNQEKKTNNYLDATFDNLFTAALPGSSVSADTKHTASSSGYTVTSRGVFGRINYNFNERYFVEANGRYDGSSKFTKNDRFQFFPSFSAGWRISQESFMESTRGWLDNLKIRGSWGKLGNQPSDNYPYQSVFQPAPAYYFIDRIWVRKVGAPGLVSSTLTWEKATTTNLGLDFTALNNRFDMSFDIYQRRVTDILTDGASAYPSVLGATPPVTNSGEIKVNGWELSVKWRDRLSNGINYDVSLILSDNYTKVVRYAGNPTKKIGDLYDGKKVGEIWGYETGGIVQESDFVDGKYLGADQSGVSLQTLYPGYTWYKDIDGDGFISSGTGTLDNPGDRRVIGNDTPRLRFGITGNISYKGFDLNLFFQGIAKRDVVTSNSAYWGGGAGSWNMYKNSWTPENTGAKFPMYDADSNNRLNQTAFMMNGAYLRLKQAVLGYTLPAHLTRSIGVDRVRLALSGYNIFEITQLPDVFDPEQLTDAYPQKRTVAFSVQIGF